MNKCEQCIIKQFNSLKALDKDELISFSICKASMHIKKGDIIFNEGDTVNGVYCINEGLCKLSKLSANGKNQIVKIIVKGDLLGYRSLVSDEVSNLQAVALTDMKLCFIPKHLIINNLQTNPKFSFEVLKEMAHNLREADDIIVNMAQKSVRQRLAETLIYIHDSFGENSDKSLSVILSREDLANIVGTATESAIRVLSQFNKENLISIKGKKIKIKDFEGLKRVH